MSLKLSNKDQEILIFLCKEYGENKSAIFKRALNEMYQKETLKKTADNLKKNVKF
jgi:hypothetical protein